MMLSISDLLQPIPGSNPSGEDARYTGVYDRIKEARREDPDLPMGEWKRERKVADWHEVAKLCTDALANQTKDLQIGCWLTEALVHCNGFPGLAGGLHLLRGLIDDFWTTVYPRSAEDELEFRAGPLEWVGSRLDVAVKSVPLTSTGVDWFGCAACDAELRERGVEAVGEMGHPRARLDEVDCCLTALRELQASCEARFGDMAPRFNGLQTSIETVRLTLEALIGKAAEAEEPALIADVYPSADKLCAREEAPLDRVHFTLTSQSTIRPASSVIVTLWVHLESQRAAVLERACQQYGAVDPTGILPVSKGPVRIARGTVLTVRIEVKGARIDEPEEPVLWDGEISPANFMVTVPANAEKRTLPGKAAIYLSGVLVAKVQFVLQVGAAPEGAIPTIETRVRKAFASYASDDRDEVLGRLQGIRKAAPHLDIFFDVLTLRSGQSWKDEVQRLIAASDVFYLFWSLNASTSVWVEQEWRTALRTGRRDFIDPVPLQPPEEAPPPAELASLHFNDWMLAFRRRRFCQSTT
jgi:type VI secretion system ImpA family protein